MSTKYEFTYLVSAISDGKPVKKVRQRVYLDLPNDGPAVKEKANELEEQTLHTFNQEYPWTKARLTRVEKNDEIIYNKPISLEEARQLREDRSRNHRLIKRRA